MKHIYLYGASDDCREIETSFDSGFEAYGDIRIKASSGEVVARYVYQGDWGIELLGDIPSRWIVTAISANAPGGFKYRRDAGQFIHIQIPDGDRVDYAEVTETT